RHRSPYRLLSDQAGDHELIDTEELRRLDELPASFAFDAVPDSPTEAYRSFELAATPTQHESFAAFVRGNREWLWPYGLFRLAERVPRSHAAHAAPPPRATQKRFPRNCAAPIPVRAAVDGAQAPCERAGCVSLRRSAVLRGSQ